jgi:hypothetical protein
VDMDLTKAKSEEDGWGTMATDQGFHCARSCFSVMCNGNYPGPAAVQDPASRHRCFHPSPSPVSCILPLSSMYASKASSFSLQINM